MSRRKRKGLVQKIRNVQVQNDGRIRFIPYCNYHHHPGVIQRDKYLECRERKCWHYFEFKITGENQVFSQD